MTTNNSSKMEMMTELLEAGVHYGHQTKRWNPKMKDFIFEEKNSIYIIDLGKTVEQLDEATTYLHNLVKGGGKVLFVGCKKQAQEAVKEAAIASGQFYVNQRWLGGTLTNLTTIRKSVKRLREIDEIEKSQNKGGLGKKELAALGREAQRMRKNLDGLMNMEKLPDALIIIDTNREEIAVAEANRLGVPIVAIVDTNCDPDRVSYPIAGNDDAIRSIRVILQKLVDAIMSGRGQTVKQDTDLAAVAE